MLGTCVSHYRILQKLAAGGMGEVYVAEDTHLGRRVAIKFPVLDDSGIENRGRFLGEARAASRLDHPNIAHIYDYGEAPDGRPFLVMELVRGTTLRDVLKGGALTAVRSIGIVDGVLRALREAHRNGLVHRDIKPSNVMLTGTNEVKVLDFGLAKEIPDDLSSQPSQAVTSPMCHTQPGALPGTPAYMSPEQARGKRLDSRSDLFSAGLLLYECLTGRPAFSGYTPREVLEQAVHADPPPPSSLTPGIPATLDRIVAKALAKDPAQRYQSADDMMADLAAAGASRAHAGIRAVQKAAAGLVSFRTKLVLLTACVAVLVLSAVWFTWHGRPQQPPPEARRWYELGAAALREGTYYKAANALERAVALYPDYSLAHARLAEARNELDDSEGAKAEMMRALPTGSSQAAQGTDALYVDAIHRTLIRDFAGAISSYTELAGKVPEAERAGVLIDLGRVRESNAETQKALDAYREAVSRDSQNAAAHLRAAILLGLRMRKLEEAAAEFDRADSLYRSLSSPEGQVQVLYHRGVVASMQPKLLSEARATLEKAIQLARAINTDQWEIASTLQLSVVTYLESDAAAAERMAAAAVEKARRAGMNNLAARGLSDLGNAQFMKPDYTRAEATFQEALELARRFGSPRNEARALLPLASVHQQQGANGAVLKEAAQALAFYQKAGFQKEALSCMTLLARANRDLGNLAEAGKAFEQLLSLAGTLGDRQQMAWAEAGIGSVLFQQGKWPDALVHYERYYEIAASINDRSGVGTALINRIKVLAVLGRYEAAGEMLHQAESQAAQPGSASALPVLIARERAEIALMRGFHQEAAARANAVLKMTSATRPVAAATKCLAGLARARSGFAAEGKRLCSQGVSEAAALSEGATLADARLALAEILLESRDPQAAQEQVRLALEVFEHSGSVESAWRAWAVAARAYRMANDRAHAQEAAEKASACLDTLRAAWNPADLKRYLERTDLRGLLAETRGRM